MDIRIGIGNDIHALVENRELWLGSVKIDYNMGLMGHSDADALIHAIMDAMLGALALGDIGKHFPDTDANYKNIESSKLLKKVTALVSEKGYKLSNLDCIVQCEKPKLTPYRKQMIEKLSKLLDLEQDRISIKFATNEGFDAVGQGKAISCQAAVIVFKP